MAAVITAPGTYQQYKNDTAIFLTWLSQAALVCGYKTMTASTSNRLQLQQIDGTIAASSNRGRVADIVRQASSVVNSISPVLQFPRAVARLAVRVIGTRRVFTAQYANNSSFVGADATAQISPASAPTRDMLSSPTSYKKLWIS